MSSTPPKNDGVEPAPQSPDDSEPHMDRDGQETQAQGLGYEFEVKEQDRWLPIANGAFISLAPPGPSDLRVRARESKTSCWMPACSCSIIARLPRQHVESRPSSRSWDCLNGCPADAPCRPLPHSRAPRRHTKPHSLHPPLLPQMLTSVTLLQSPAS